MNDQKVIITTRIGGEFWKCPVCLKQNWLDDQYCIRCNAMRDLNIRPKDWLDEETKNAEERMNEYKIATGILESIWEYLEPMDDDEE